MPTAPLHVRRIDSTPCAPHLTRLLNTLARRCEEIPHEARCVPSSAELPFALLRLVEMAEEYALPWCGLVLGSQCWLFIGELLNSSTDEPAPLFKTHRFDAHGRLNDQSVWARSVNGLWYLRSRQINGVV